MALDEVEDALVGGVDLFEAGERAGERAEGVGVVYGREGEGGAVGGVEGPGGLFGEFLVTGKDQRVSRYDGTVSLARSEVRLMQGKRGGRGGPCWLGRCTWGRGPVPA